MGQNRQPDMDMKEVLETIRHFHDQCHHLSDLLELGSHTELQGYIDIVLKAFMCKHSEELDDLFMSIYTDKSRDILEGKYESLLRAIVTVSKTEARLNQLDVEQDFKDSMDALDS